MTITFRRNFVFDMLVEGHSLYCITFDPFVHMDSRRELYDWLQDPQYTAILTNLYQDHAPTFDFFNTGTNVYFSGDAEMMQLKLTWNDVIISVAHCDVTMEDGKIASISWNTIN